jgi:regulator of nonsense transcripts 1
MVTIEVLAVEIPRCLHSCRHEKLYEEIEAKVIRSDELPDSGSEVSKMFGGATVVLCTLSMLSNPKLADCGLYDILPVKSLVIDEASQIDVFEFMVIPVPALSAITNALD